MCFVVGICFNSLSPGRYIKIFSNCHYLNQCWPRSVLPYRITRPQWLNWINWIPDVTVYIGSYDMKKKSVGTVSDFMFQSATVVSVNELKSSVPSSLQYKTHFSRQLNCWSLRCSWSIVCRHCSNYIFILNLTPGFNGLGKDNYKMRWEAFKFWDLVHLILKTLR